MKKNQFKKQIKIVFNSFYKYKIHKYNRYSFYNQTKNISYFINRGKNMRCPNCGARIKKGDDRCLKCGTKIQQIKGASNARVRQVKKEYQPELVVYSTVFPSDLSYKKTLIWCIFLGWMGAHYYYVKRYVSGAILSIMSAVFLLCSVPAITVMQTGSAGIFTPIGILFLTSSLYVIPSAIGALGIIIWAIDIIRLLTKSFSVPVVLADNDNVNKK